MLLVIHNLPSNTRYSDVKSLIKHQCGLTEMIVDNLMSEGDGKRVTVGFADEADASLMMRKLNGSYVGKQQIYIEHAKSKKTEQPYKQMPSGPPNQYDQGQYNQLATPQHGTGYYAPQNPAYYPPPTRMDMPQQVPPANFGVPFYMTVPNPIVGNTQQHMVQYPQVQGPSDPHTGENRGAKRSYEGDRICPGSPKQGSQGHSRASSSRWSEPNRDSSDGWKVRDKTPPRDHDRYNEDRSYKDNSYQDYYSRSKQRDDQSYGSNRQGHDRYEKSYNRSEPNSEGFDQPSQSFRSNSNDYNKVDTQGRHYEQEREPKYLPPHESIYTRRDNYQKNKRPYEHHDVKSDYQPHNKKVNTQEFYSKNYAGDSGNPQYQSKNYAGTSGNQQFQPKNYAGNSGNQQFQPKNYAGNSGNQQFQSKNCAGASGNQQFQPKSYAGSSGKQQLQPKNYAGNSGSQFSRNRANSPPHDKSIYYNKIAKQGTVQPPQQTKFKPNKKKQPNKRSDEYRQPKPPKIKKDLLIRYEGWICQATSTIAQQILKNVACPFFSKKHPVIVKLKACVRARLDVIVDGTKAMKPGDILASYREKFPERDDRPFYAAVVQKVDKGEMEEFDAAQKERFENKVREGDNPSDESKLNAPKIPAKPIPNPKPDIQFEEPNPDKKLPKYPNASKKVSSQMKKAQKEELTNDSLYMLDNMGEKILKQELDTLCNIFKEEIEVAEDDAEKAIGEFLNSIVLPNMRKVMSLLVKKRVLDIRTNLAVRINCQPKCPNRTLLDSFVRRYGVVSLKKSDMKKKLYVATCNSYENYDALIRVGHVSLDGITCWFKPLLSFEKMKSCRNKMQRANEDTEVNYEEEGEEMGEENEGEETGDGNEGEEMGEGNEGEGVWGEGETDVMEIHDDPATNEGDSKAASSNIIVLDDELDQSAETIVIEEDHEDHDKFDAAGNEEGTNGDGEVFVVSDNDNIGDENTGDGGELCTAGQVVEENGAVTSEEATNGDGEVAKDNNAVSEEVENGEEATVVADGEQLIADAVIDFTEDDLEDF